ncbi:phage tail sheath subtilisin-like domain-containing protein [Azospirillum soli]|uniref:phage tail sheath subtilisin-like domain-containing protein n=1 Tax=Azospirillum soli TaxID=1304799 RepID=UPI001AE8B2AF|nr:phage tail sheath subtilisin-like domain-containing protein [Azospirillum soli]MBP2314902.1 phage tail sheath gpL-like [Azospirillum soli]
MAVSFSNIPANIRVPLFYAEVDSSQAGYFVQDQRALLIGQMLPAGTAAAGIPVLVSGVDQARGLFGAGSLLARMVAAYRANDDFGGLWCLPLADDGAAVAATGTITLTGTATAAGTLSLYIAGQLVRQGVASGAAAATAATALAATINASADLPVTAAAVSATVTLTAKNKGAAGNDIDVRLNYRGTAGGEALPTGVGVTFVAMAGGTANPSLAAGLAALGDEPFDFIATPYTDTASLDALKQAMDGQTGRWAWSKQIYGHVFGAKRGTVSALSTFGNGRNDPHATVLGYSDSPTPPWEWAAALAAQAAKSLRIDPARPLQTLPLVGVLAAPMSSRFTLAERQILLFDGIATHMTGTDGIVRIERAITTYQTNAFGQLDPSYLDVETLFTLATILRRMRNAITTKFPRHKLASDGTRFGDGQAIVTPKIIKAELIAEYSAMEQLGLVENMPAFKAALVVERDPTDPNRINVLYPPDLVNQLRVFAVLAQFRLQYSA